MVVARFVVATNLAGRKPEPLKPTMVAPTNLEMHHGDEPRSVPTRPFDA